MSEPEQKTGNKLVLVGDSGVGKTCLISRFLSGNFDKNQPSTNGASYASKLIEYPNLKKSLVLDIWDTAGQEKFRSLTKFFYKDALMVIMVYDITRRESFDNLKNFWYQEIQENAEPNIVLAVAGNKCDLYEQEAVAENEAREYAKSINALFALTSAQNNTGVAKLFKDIGNKFLDPNFQNSVNERKRTPSVALKKKEHVDNPKNPEVKKKKKCC